MRQFFTALATLLCFLCPAFASATSLPNIDAFFESQELGSFDLSPNGQFLVITDGRHDKNMLLIKDLDKGGAPQSIDFGDTKIKWARWATDQRLIVSLIVKTDVRLPVGYYTVVDGTRKRTMPDVKLGRLVAINRDGTQLVNMMADANSKVKRNFNLTQVTSLLPNDPDHILMPATEQHLSLFKVNIHTGKAERIEKGNHLTESWLTDSAGNPIARFDYNGNSRRYTIYTKPPDSTKWDKLVSIKEKELETFSPIALTEDPSKMYVSATPEGKDRAGIYVYDLKNKSFENLIAEHPRLDLEDALTYSDGRYAGAAFYDERLTYRFQDPTLNAQLKAINRYFKNEANVQISKINSSGNRWVLFVSGPGEPGAYYAYTPSTKKIDHIAFLNTALHPDQLGRTQTLHYKTRDGQTIEALLTTPPAHFSGMRPLIVFPHGGPASHDTFGFNIQTQFLASRGYQVFQPNFRGSTGYGKAFEKAGHGEWGGRMQDDITDGVKYLIAQNKVDPNRICIMGNSYGGYAALMGAVKTPELYRCAVSVNGVSDLRATLREITKEFGHNTEQEDDLVESIDTKRHNKEALKTLSPLYQTESITIPVLLIHGEDDGRVSVKQSQTMAAKLQRNGKPVLLRTIEGTGHNLTGYHPKDEQGKDWYHGFKTALRETEHFLKNHLPAR